jgi:hypothetical protein
MRHLLMAWFLLTATIAHAHHDGVLTPQAKPVVGDFDGDGVQDRGVYLDGWWYVQMSALGLRALRFGEPGEEPLVEDTDHDQIADPSLFHPLTRRYRVLRSRPLYRGAEPRYSHCEHLTTCVFYVLEHATAPGVTWPFHPATATMPVFGGDP